LRDHTGEEADHSWSVIIKTDGCSVLYINPSATYFSASVMRIQMKH
jgi:hypothetical protein